MAHLYDVIIVGGGLAGNAFAYALAQRGFKALLLEAGADPRLRTRIDEYETPRDLAEKAGLGEIAALLAEYEARLGRK